MHQCSQVRKSQFWCQMWIMSRWLEKGWARFLTSTSTTWLIKLCSLSVCCIFMFLFSLWCCKINHIILLLYKNIVFCSCDFMIVNEIKRFNYLNKFSVNMDAASFVSAIFSHWNTPNSETWGHKVSSFLLIIMTLWCLSCAFNTKYDLSDMTWTHQYFKTSKRIWGKDTN